ncbi:hypothetical protein ACFY5F_45490 [Streptomyces sp. NPDC013161]|uniref:hypothetical protein n=1 Tax=Streptomyces sp. NPDC013161 TaxID=3364862 RepID=UPI0036CC760D
MTTTTTTAARRNGKSPEEPEQLLDTAPDPRPGLRAYLEVKRAALLARREAQQATPPRTPARDRSAQAAWEICGNARGGVVTLYGPVGAGLTELPDALGEFTESDGVQVLMAASPPLGIIR